MYEFEYVTSSLEYPQSKDKVENVEKTSNNLMWKGASTNSACYYVTQSPYIT